MDLLDLPAQPTFEGRSLVPFLIGTSPLSRLATWLRPGGATAPRDVIMQLRPKAAGADDRKHVLSIVRGPNKLIVGRDGSHEAFDLAADPLEKSPNPEGLAPMKTVLAAALSDADSDLASRAGAAVAGETLDDGTKEKLRALGYQP
jgi:hypothetical protein